MGGCRLKKIPCEVFSRVVGYFRPVKQWNKGKQEEFWQRKNLNLRGMTHECSKNAQKKVSTGKGNCRG